MTEWLRELLWPLAVINRRTHLSTFTSSSPQPFHIARRRPRSKQPEGIDLSYLLPHSNTPTWKRTATLRTSHTHPLPDWFTHQLAELNQKKNLEHHARMPIFLHSTSSTYLIHLPTQPAHLSHFQILSYKPQISLAIKPFRSPSIPIDNNDGDSNDVNVICKRPWWHL